MAQVGKFAWQVTWPDATGAVLQTDTTNVVLGATWAHSQAAVVAPPDTAQVLVDILNRAGGHRLYRLP